MVSPFLKLFGRSPFRPLHDHMAVIFDCVHELIPFFNAVVKKDWPKAEKRQQEIAALEQKADELKRDMRLNLPKTLFLPVARNDLLELVSCQDHLANLSKDIAGLIVGRQMEFPKEIQADMLSLLGFSVDATKQAFKATRELNELLEAGFSGEEKAIIKNLLNTLHDIEYKADKMQIKIHQELFQLEDNLPPVSVMFLYKIIESIGTLADIAEKVGDRLQICISR